MGELFAPSMILSDTVSFKSDDLPDRGIDEFGMPWRGRFTALGSSIHTIVSDIGRRVFKYNVSKLDCFITLPYITLSDKIVFEQQFDFDED